MGSPELYQYVCDWQSNSLHVPEKGAVEVTLPTVRPPDLYLMAIVFERACLVPA